MTRFLFVIPLVLMASSASAQQQAGPGRLRARRLAVLPGADAGRRSDRAGLPEAEPRQDQQGLPADAGEPRAVGSVRSSQMEGGAKRKPSARIWTSSFARRFSPGTPWDDVLFLHRPEFAQGSTPPENGGTGRPCHVSIATEFAAKRKLPEDPNGGRNHGIDRRDHHDRLHPADCRQARARRRCGSSCIIGLALMLWAFWWDDWHPLFKRETEVTPSALVARQRQPHPASRLTSQFAVRSSRASSPAGPTSCTPSGMPPSPVSSGSDTAGSPVSVHSEQNSGISGGRRRSARPRSSPASGSRHIRSNIVGDAGRIAARRVAGRQIAYRADVASFRHEVAQLPGSAHRRRAR